LREFLKVVAVDPEYAEALNNIGVIYKERGSLDDAITPSDGPSPPIRSSPDRSATWPLILEQRGDLKGAEENFRNALQRDPENVQVRTNYGALLYSMGHFDQARIELEKAVVIDPGDASARNKSGAVYGRLGRMTDESPLIARRCLSTLIMADVHHNLGLAF